MPDLSAMTGKERDEWVQQHAKAVVAAETKDGLVKRIGEALGEVPYALVYPTMEVPVWVVSQLLNELEEARWELKAIHEELEEARWELKAIHEELEEARWELKAIHERKDE